jgi:hypothetical protein
MTLGRNGAPLTVIQTLLHVHQCLCPEQIIDWSNILRELAASPSSTGADDVKTFCFLTSCSIEKRVKAIGLKNWRESMVSWLRNTDWHFSNKRYFLNRIHSNLADYEYKYRKLKEAALVLELAVWKAKINESRSDDVVSEDIDNKRSKIDESEFRIQCRIGCGADHIIENILPYLLTPDEDMHIAWDVCDVISI